MNWVLFLKCEFLDVFFTMWISSNSILVSYKLTYDLFLICQHLFTQQMFKYLLWYSQCMLGE